MAAPIITGVTATPVVLPAGGTGQIHIDAFDPDTGVLTLTVTVTDTAGGNQVTQPFEIPVGDPITYQLTVDRGSVIQDPTDPALWHWTDD